MPKVRALCGWGWEQKRSWWETMRTSWEQKDFDELFDGNKRTLIATVWELDENKKDFDGFIDGNKKILMRTIWELDAEEKNCYFCYLGRKIP